MTPIAFGVLHLRRGAVLRFLLWSLPEALPAAMLGVAVARSVDHFLAGRSLVGLAWLAAIIPVSLCSAVGARQVLRGLGEMVEPMRDELVRRVVGSSLARALDGQADDGAVARLTRQVEIVRDSFAGLLMVTRDFVVGVVGVLLGLLALSPWVMLFVGPPFLLGVAGFVASLGLSARRQRAAVLAEERLAATASTVVAGARDAIACGASGHAAAMVAGPIEDQAAAERALSWTAVVRTLCFAVGGWLPLIALLMAVPWLTGRGLTPGEVLGGLTYVLFGLQPAMRKLMGGLGGAGLRYTVTLGRLLEQRVTPPAAVKGAGTRLEARHVTFAYGPHSEPVFRDLSLAVGEGAHLAVIGPSGIGKSTLAMVLCGLRHPSSGEVVVADRVLIPQEAYVFSATVRENLAYLRPGADDALLNAAAAAVGAGTLVEELGGLDAVVEPGRLSAGQRQLIALARAYLSSAPIVILDEATCHLDPATEAVAEQAFARRPGGLIVIAHRLSSALRAKRILVLDGAGAQLGDHAGLLERSALYRELISSLAHEPPGSPRSGSASPSWSGSVTGGSGPSPD
ncbi:ATP-binding cassette domain-containing protein [Allorhizocola rhizosphaerae]|uniref:ATP-binding cassette domain-containing protein n=1 Tax=Allorhizocola rhizosphaerae TaxID=1872709 RepID=UPI000E3CA0A1|nr:ABC transporter ATP-binding protein [Allorhizocola rhizosphaerae]